jgi:hypothetical protein
MNSKCMSDRRVLIYIYIYIYIYMYKTGRLRTLFPWWYLFIPLLHSKPLHVFWYVVPLHSTSFSIKKSTDSILQKVARLVNLAHNQSVITYDISILSNTFWDSLSFKAHTNWFIRALMWLYVNSAYVEILYRIFSKILDMNMIFKQNFTGCFWDSILSLRPINTWCFRHTFRSEFFPARLLGFENFR